ncbi:MAG: hypothetical protein IJI22_02825 [Bacilli bacterium]|nr:hypothetical protein [Bacilli bacterium]
MKKIFLLILIFTLFSFIIKIPNYIELNNLVIVEGIGLECNNDKYTLYLKEIIPIKGDNGVTYKYKYYENEAENIDDANKNIINDYSNKKFFYEDTKYVITNCKTSNEITDYFRIKPKYIKHVDNNILVALKK